MSMESYLRVNALPGKVGQRPGMHQIVEVICQQIASDPALQGVRLPPVRVLAHQLGISKNTVSAAYEELQSKSLIESRGRMGLYVAKAEAGFVVPPRKTVPAPTLKIFPPVLAPPFKVPGAIQLSMVFIDPTILPKEKLTACFRSVLKIPGLADFPDRQGFLPLRRKIAQRLQKRGIEARAENIITTIGSQQAIDLVCRIVASQTVATEDPAYYVGKALFEMSGLKTIGLPVDPVDGILAESWEKSLDQYRPGLAYLTTNFQNPTGYSYTSRELQQIIDWSTRFGFGILEDDWGSDMLSFSEFKPSLRALGGQNVFYMNSFTKKLLPSLRVGYIVGNEKTMPALSAAKRVSTSAVPGLIEAALFEFLDRGYYDAHLKKIQLILDTRYKRCLELLEALMPEEARWTLPGGGPVLWLDLPKRIDVQALAAKMLEKKVIIQLSHDAFIGKPWLNGFKIGYAYISEKEMEQALELVSNEIRKML